MLPHQLPIHGVVFGSNRSHINVKDGGRQPSLQPLLQKGQYNSDRALPGVFSVSHLGYVCNPRSLKEGTETSRRRTVELGSRLETPILFECKLNEPMHIGMRLLHPAAADHSVSISRQQVQRVFRFSLRSRAGARPLSSGTGAVATGRDVSVPSFRERGLHT